MMMTMARTMADVGDGDDDVYFEGERTDSGSEDDDEDVYGDDDEKEGKGERL